MSTYIIQKYKKGYRIMEYYEYCPYEDSNLECEHCKDHDCQLESNQSFIGYYITKQTIEHYHISAKDIGEALILEDGEFLFDGIDTIFELVLNAIENIVRDNKCSEGMNILQKCYDKYCFNRICEEGEYSMFMISRGDCMSILSKYVNKVIHVPFKLNPIVTDEKVLNLIIDKDADRIFISEEDSQRVYTYLRASIRMIYEMVSCKYDYLQLFWEKWEKWEKQDN